MKVVRQKIGDEVELALCCASQNEVTAWQSVEPEVDPAFYGELFGG